MAPDPSLGDFEEFVLIAILRLRDNAYGVTIRRLIEEETSKTISIGAIYTTLERLEKKGYLSSRQGESTPERGGRAKRYFKIEGAGERALSNAHKTHVIRQKLLKGLTGWNPVGGTI
jgi:DNA-binding PadR family transcriptional regulator